MHKKRVVNCPVLLAILVSAGNTLPDRRGASAAGQAFDGSSAMSFWTCEQCGAQFPESDAPPASGPICEDERQFVTSKRRTCIGRDELTTRPKLAWRYHIEMLGSSAERAFA